MSGTTKDDCLAPQLDLFDIAVIDLPATATPKEDRGGNAMISRLGRRTAVASRKGSSASRRSPGLGSKYVSHGTFEMTPHGLTTEVTRGRGEARTTDTEPVSGPFEILGRSRNSVGGGWGLWLHWSDGDRRMHQRLVSAASLHGEPGLLCQALASEGLFIERDKQKELARYLNGAQVTRRATVVDHTGWHVIAGRQVFVLPNETIGSPDSEFVILDGAASTAYQARGSLEDWRAGVGRLAGGHSLPVLAISAALAGPLVNLVGAEGANSISSALRREERPRFCKLRPASGGEAGPPVMSELGERRRTAWKARRRWQATQC